jgi:hypothetical protein
MIRHNVGKISRLIAAEHAQVRMHVHNRHGVEIRANFAARLMHCNSSGRAQYSGISLRACSRRQANSAKVNKIARSIRMWNNVAADRPLSNEIRIFAMHLIYLLHSSGSLCAGRGFRIPWLLAQQGRE